jgi:hypothetical protein
MRMTFAVILGLSGICLSIGEALGEGFDQEPLSLRFPAALSRFASYGDVAAVGGASAGSKWSSSTNPASADWEHIPGPLSLAFTPQVSTVDFRNGTSLGVYAEALTYNLAQAGTVQLALAQVRSNEEPTRQGLDFQFDADIVQVLWGKRLSNDWAVGAGFIYTKSKTQFDIPGFDLPVSDTDSETYNLRAGLLRQVTPSLRAGLVFDYAWSPARTVVHDFLDQGTGDEVSRDTGQQYLIRPGLAYEYMKDSVLYTDYQFGQFHDATGTLRVHRLLVGVDHCLMEGLFVRAGATLDARGNVAWTTGLGLYPSKQFSIDVGYQDNMFPELGPEFGRSRTLTISIGFTF